MAWRRAYEDAELTQSAKNGISMNHQLHFWFDHARFALKPLRETSECIIVQWHWLRSSLLQALDVIPSDEDIENTLRYVGVMDQGWGDWVQDLAFRPSGVAIQTGQTFLLEKHEQMPSWDLLEIQWDLLRVAAICGAADLTDDYYDPENRWERECDEAISARQQAIAAQYAILTGQGSISAKEEMKEAGKRKEDSRAPPG